MCRNRPGVRCSDHSLKNLSAVLVKGKSVDETITSLKQQIEISESNGEPTKGLKTQLTKAEAKAEALKLQEEEVTLEYNATPRGQKDLEDQINDPANTDARREQLEIDKAVALARRQWQQTIMSRLKKAQKDGGMAKAIFLAQQDMVGSEAKIQDIAQKILNKETERDELDAFSKSPKGRHPSSFMKTMAAVNRLNKVIYTLRKQKLLMALITNDLDKYIKSSSRRLGKNLFMGGVKAGTKILIH